MAGLGAKGEDLLDALLDLGVSTGELRERDGIFRIVGRRSMAGCWALPDLAEFEATLLDSGFPAVRRVRLIPVSQYWGFTASALSRYSNSASIGCGISYGRRAMFASADARSRRGTGCGSLQ